MAKPAPTDQQFETAIIWLQSNEGDCGEAEACRQVADWIERQRTTASLLGIGTNSEGPTYAGIYEGTWKHPTMASHHD